MPRAALMVAGGAIRGARSRGRSREIPLRQVIGLRARGVHGYWRIVNGGVIIAMQRQALVDRLIGGLK